MKVLQFTYMRVLAFIIMMMVGGSAWAETMLNTTYTSGSVTIRDNAKTHESKDKKGNISYDDLSISGSTTIVVISGNLTVNGELSVSDGAILIVEGSLDQHKKISVNGGSIVVSPHYDKNTNYDVWNSHTSDIQVQGSGLIAILGDYKGAVGSVINVKGNDSDDYVYATNGLTIWGNQKYDGTVALEKAMTVISNASNAGLLPISLTSFSASQNGEEIEIAWTTNSEVNNDYFTVEYSIDGV